MERPTSTTWMRCSRCGGEFEIPNGSDTYRHRMCPRDCEGALFSFTPDLTPAEAQADAEDAALERYELERDCQWGCERTFADGDEDDERMHAYEDHGVRS